MKLSLLLLIWLTTCLAFQQAVFEPSLVAFNQELLYMADEMCFLQGV